MVVMSDEPGPQRGPASVPQIEAQLIHNRRELQASEAAEGLGEAYTVTNCLGGCYDPRCYQCRMESSKPAAGVSPRSICSNHAASALAAQQEEISQTLGKALGYPWFKDDQKKWNAHPWDEEPLGEGTGDDH